MDNRQLTRSSEQRGEYHKLYLTPLLGICLFIMLYIVAAFMYPGGSVVDKQATSFNIVHNYWCDLFDVVAHNGISNPARPIAIGGMVILCFSFASLFYILPNLFQIKNNSQKGIQYLGMASMLIAVFLFTKYHEEVINSGSLLGSIALLLTFIELYKAHYYRLFTLGILCLTLCCFNYFIYQTGILLPFLASAQKVTFLLFLYGAGLSIFVYTIKLEIPKAKILRGGNESYNS